MNKVIFLDVDGVLNNGTWAIEMFDKGIRVYHDDHFRDTSIGCCILIIREVFPKLIEINVYSNLFSFIFLAYHRSVQAEYDPSLFIMVSIHHIISADEFFIQQLHIVKPIAALRV